MHIQPNKAGLVLGAVVGGVHLLWSLLVLVGWAQGLANFSMWAHMARFDLVVGPFDLSAAVTVIVVAALIGYCVGYAFATVWNNVHG